MVCGVRKRKRDMKENPIKTALQDLLNNLDKIAAEHTGTIDTVVREALQMAIFDYFVLPVHNFRADEAGSYGMISDEGDKEIHEALSQFLVHPDVIRARIELPSSEERLEAFMDEEVQSSEGSCSGDYFGWWARGLNNFGE
jgi:hypothetical protein